jgi:hypothetical protein
MYVILHIFLTKVGELRIEQKRRHQGYFMSIICHPLKGPLWVPHFRRGWVSAALFLLQQQQLTIRETAVQTRRIRPIYSDHVPAGIRLAFKWNIHPFPPLLDRGKFILKQN